jgi:CubicO group peptidase (beta-lactamase class C family)
VAYRAEGFHGKLIATRFARLFRSTHHSTSLARRIGKDLSTKGVGGDNRFVPQTLCCLAIWLLFCLRLTAADLGEIDRYLQGRMQQLHIPGLSVAVARDGAVIKKQGYGVANLELRTPASSETVYELGSVTKQFTAAAVMLLIEDGRIRLDDSIRKFFPEAPPAWNGITIRHLLTHTSGIQNHVAIPGWLTVFKTSILSENSPTRDELLRLFFRLPLEFQPGETWSYDNTGYYLLGIIVEKVSGQSYWQFLDARIFRPLGMGATRSTDPEPLVPNRASGYGWKNGRFENRPILAPFIAFSAGSILSTVEDMSKWSAALEGERLLKKSSLDQMWTAAKTRNGDEAPFNYGFGWFIDSYHGHRIFQHSGGTPGFSSLIYRFPDDRLSVIILTNHSDCILDQLAIDVAGNCLPQLKRTEADHDANPEVTTRLKKVFADLLEQRYDPALFTAPMQIFLKTATAKSLWDWFAEHGQLTDFVFADQESVSNGRLLRYHVILGGNHYWYSFKLTSEGKIAQIRWW